MLMGLLPPFPLPRGQPCMFQELVLLKPGSGGGGRLKIPTTRSAHPLVTLNRDREAMDFDVEPKTLHVQP